MIGRLLVFRSMRNRTKVPDEDLVTACGCGDNSALDELFQRHGDSVYRLLHRLGGVDAKDLEDLLQTTFLEVQRSAARFDCRSAVKTWIVGIAVNVRRHHVRGEMRRRSFIAAATPIAEALPGPRPPDELMLEQQSMVRLQSGVDALPEALRVVFTLCDIEGIKGTESAKILKLPAGTVWRRLHEARMRLRAFIEEDEDKR
jgi:RNA polymerase sigma factor (sigma-70 family)